MKLYNAIKNKAGQFISAIANRTRGVRGVEVQTLIHDAIAGKGLIAIDYKGDGIRYIEPHAIGATKAGNIVLRAYQRSGASRTDGANGAWRLFTVAEITKARGTWRRFDVRDGYKRDDRAMQGGISAQL